MPGDTTPTIPAPLGVEGSGVLVILAWGVIGDSTFKYEYLCESLKLGRDSAEVLARRASFKDDTDDCFCRSV